MVPDPPSLGLSSGVCRREQYSSVKREERLAIGQTGTLQISLVFSFFLRPQAMTLLLGGTPEFLGTWDRMGSP